MGLLDLESWGGRGVLAVGFCFGGLLFEGCAIGCDGEGDRA